LELMIALGNDAMIAAGKTRGHGGSKAAAAGVTASESTSARRVPPILKTIAARNQGTTELVAAIDRHRAGVAETEAGQARMRDREREAMRESLREALIDAAEHAIAADLERAVEDVVARRADPYSATETLVAAFRAKT
jgi:LAO/AO transport system kinase